MATFKDRVRETTNTTGQGDITLEGAVTSFNSFGSAFGVDETFYYAIVDDLNAEWEIGEGSLANDATIKRTTVYDSTNGGEKVDFGSGQKSVFVTYPAKRAVTDTQAIAFSVALGG